MAISIEVLNTSQGKQALRGLVKGLPGLLLAGALGVFACFSSAAASAEPAKGPIDPANSQQQPEDQSATRAELESVKDAFEMRFGGLQATAVRAAPVPGIYEVQLGMDLIYVDADVNYVFQGSLMDAATGVDLTAARMQKLSEVPFETLPLEYAIQVVKGDGSRKLAVFEDPNCVYCKQLHASLKDIDNITLYSFQFPILSPDSRTKANNIWCAGDSAAVLQAWMLEGAEPPAAQCDDSPVEQVLKLGNELMVRGTPALFFEDGSRISGTLPADQLSLKLDSMN